MNKDREEKKKMDEQESRNRKELQDMCHMQIEAQEVLKQLGLSQLNKRKERKAE